MSSDIVKLIRDGLVTNIQAMLPLWKQSRYVWDLTKNSTATHSKLFAVRPMASQSVDGTNQTITEDHDFEVELSTRFNNQGLESDKNQDDTIMMLFEEHKKLSRAIHRRNLSIQRVLVISFVDTDAPVIDNVNGTVSVTATYTIKYRL